MVREGEGLDWAVEEAASFPCALVATSFSCRRQDHLD